MLIGSARFGNVSDNGAECNRKMKVFLNGQYGRLDGLWASAITERGYDVTLARCGSQGRSPSGYPVLAFWGGLA